MKTTMVRERTVRLSNGDIVIAAPYEPHDINDVHDTVRWFNSVRPSWMDELTATTIATRPVAWMR